jgi:positive regulator of sigma E activity
MKKIATIKKIDKENIFATYNDSEGHAKAFFKTKEDLTFKINNSKNIFLLQGDSVEIYIEPRGAITLSFFMFIMPLISFVVFYSVTGSLFNNIPEFFNILIGILGIVLSFLSTYIFYKSHPQKLPEVIRKIQSRDIAASCSAGCGTCSSCG